MQQLRDVSSIDLVAGNTVGHVVLFVLGVFLTLIVAKAAQALLRGSLKHLTAKSKTKLDDILLDTLGRPIYWIVLFMGFRVAVLALKVPDVLDRTVQNVVTVVVSMFLAWSLSNLITALRKAYVNPHTESSESKLDDQVVPILENALKVCVWSFGVLIIFSNLGYDIVSLLTGLGIGGLALAMAAKDTLSNVFGSLTIFADKPFQVDDVVILAGYSGTVAAVGLRTCRLRTFNDTLVTIPNAGMVGGAIENLSAREARKFTGTIGLVYETNSEQLEAAIAAVKEILGGHEKVREDFAVRFANFGDSALEISILYWVVPPGDFFDVVHEINLGIKRACDANGWDMAFPSMTIYRGDTAAS